MKKILLIFVIFFFLFISTACSNNAVYKIIKTTEYEQYLYIEYNSQGSVIGNYGEPVTCKQIDIELNVLNCECFYAHYEVKYYEENDIDHKRIIINDSISKSDKYDKIRFTVYNYKSLTQDQYIDTDNPLVKQNRQKYTTNKMTIEVRCYDSSVEPQTTCGKIDYKFTITI